MVRMSRHALTRVKVALDGSQDESGYARARKDVDETFRRDGFGEFLSNMVYASGVVDDYYFPADEDGAVETIHSDGDAVAFRYVWVRGTVSVP